MSRLLVVRHGQASAGSDDYDRLSDLGKRQARILGEHWAARGLVLDRVVAGTHRRHLETAEAAGRAFADAGGDWPECEPLAAFDEHAGYAVVMQSLEELHPSDPKIAAWVEALRGSEQPDLEVFWEAFRYVTRRWARGELELERNDHEPWRVFRARVEAGLDQLAGAVPAGRNVAVFTSAGPSGVAAAAALELGDEAAVELTWSVENSAVTQVVWGSRGLRLECFNSASHLAHPELVTRV